jgi:hypothetical protein
MKGFLLPLAWAALFGLCRALLIVSNASAQQSDDRLQDRYKLCMERADANYLEEFRGECDALCIRQKREPHRAPRSIQGLTLTLHVAYPSF